MLLGQNRAKNYTKEQLLADPKYQDLYVVGESVHFLKRRNALAKIGVYVGKFPNLTAKECAYLSLCRTECDILIVALYGDMSLRFRKEQNVCSQSTKERAFMVASLPFVDWVVSFDEETPDACISHINPDMIFTGLYTDDDKQVTLLRDKIKFIDHPFEKTEMPKKKLDLKFFDLG